MLTTKCRKLYTQNPCDVRHLGSQADEVSNPATLQWDISSRNNSGGNTLGQLIDRLINMRREIGVFDYQLVGEILKAREDDLTAEQRAYMAQRLPLLNLFIYCAPCVCLIHTALSISKRLSSPLLKIHVRPDDRLVSSCCVRADRTLGLSSTLERVREWESEACEDASNHLASFLDIVWLDRRLDHLHHEQPYAYEEGKTTNEKKRVLVIGEADYLASLVQKAPGRIPLPMDIWEFNTDDRSSPTRALFGRFIESRCKSSQAPLPGPLAPAAITVIPQQTETLVTGVRRSSSPLASDGKRRRPNITGSGAAGSGRDVPSEEGGMRGVVRACEASAERNPLLGDSN